jgi:hypothetical protein
LNVATVDSAPEAVVAERALIAGICNTIAVLADSRLAVPITQHAIIANLVLAPEVVIPGHLAKIFGRAILVVVARVVDADRPFFRFTAEAVLNRFLYAIKVAPGRVCGSMYTIALAVSHMVAFIIRAVVAIVAVE